VNARNTKIDEFDSEITVTNEDVFRFDVSVNHLLSEGRKREREREPKKQICHEGAM
jgi:hypothetical protein